MMGRIMHLIWRVGRDGWIPWLSLLAIVAMPAHAALEGPALQVVAAAHDQANPAVVELTNRGVWFVAWEERRNQDLSGVDVYGRFVTSDGQLCGPELLVATGGGNQTRPAVAYRDSFSGGTDRVLVVWQDSGSAGQPGNIRHRPINLSGSGIDCNAVTSSWLGGEQPVSYTQSARWNGVGTTVSRGDALLLREQPSVSYEPSSDSFWLAWVERRSLQQHISEVCFSRLSDAAVITYDIGDPAFIGYVELDADALGGGGASVERMSVLGTAGADILRNSTERSVRRLSDTYAEMQEVYTYEYFTDVANVRVVSDTTAPETLIAWEGVALEGTLTCTCVDLERDLLVDDQCEVGEPHNATFESKYRFATTDEGADAEAGEEEGSHVYVLPVSRIGLGSMRASRVDDLNNESGHHPALGFDPISGKFLSAWEDGRDGGAKVYGQLLTNSGGDYGENFIISYTDSDGDGEQDSNVAESRQTRPAVAFDTTNQRFFVAWQDGRNSRISLENLDIYGQYLDFEGSLRGDNFPLAVAAGNQSAPALAYNGDNHQFLTVWKSGESGTFGDIVGQRFSLGQPQLNLVKPDDTALVPPLFDFGVLTAGETATQTVKLINSGDTRVTVDCVTPYPAVEPYSYTFVVPDVLQACNDGETLELVPSSEYLLGVSYQPQAPGTAISEFSVVSDAGSPKIFLQGIATEEEGTSASIVVRPTAVDCGNIRSTETSSYNVVVSNNGNVDVTVTAVDQPTGGTPFVLSGVEDGSLVPAGEDLYVVVRCDGSLVAEDADVGSAYSSRFGLLFDSGVSGVQVDLDAVLVADGSSIGSPTTPGGGSTVPPPQYGGTVSEWRVTDTYQGVSQLQPDPLYVELAADGSLYGRWGGYSFPILHQPGVGWVWRFSNGARTWEYTITYAAGGVAGGTWNYTDLGGFRSADSATEARLVRP